jgi:hypothetical protein
MAGTSPAISMRGWPVQFRLLVSHPPIAAHGRPGLVLRPPAARLLLPHRLYSGRPCNEIGAPSGSDLPDDGLPII